ncbi:NERD domain-containing protein [Bacillaceae bacterium S4-13-58]
MATYFGREQLENSLNLAKRQEDIKGIQGEIMVGNLLDQYLPDDTYLIAQPEIGNYQPDFLVISPRYGFRIIEVKNLSLNGISNIQSNGNFVTRYGSRNYLNQVRAHVDDLKSYLLSNHPYLGDPHKMIGYCVLYVGFSKSDFERKFDVQIDSWDESHTNDYFKYHLFLDQLNGHIDAVLGNASKFPTNKNTPLTTTRMKEIANNVKIGETQIREEIASESELQEPVSVSRQQGETTNSNKKGMWAFVSLFLVILSAIALYFTMSPKDSTSLDRLDNKVGELITVEAEVTDFYYDEGSKTKFLTIRDETGVSDAIIFNDVKVPYITEGEVYTFTGEVQRYDGNIELKVESVE